MKIVKRCIYSCIVFVTFLQTPVTQIASAQTATRGEGEPLFKNPIGVDSIEGIIAVILEFVVKIGTVIVVFFIIYSGFLFVKAQGDPGKINEAKKTFMWTVIGGIILIGAQVLSTVVCNTANNIGAGAPC